MNGDGRKENTEIQASMGSVGLPPTTVAAAIATTTATVSTAAAFVATAAATVSTAAAVSTSAAAATTTWFAWFGCVHAECTTLIVVFVESFNGRVELALVTESHECKSFGLPGVTVGDDLDPFNWAMCGEEV